MNDKQSLTNNKRDIAPSQSDNYSRKVLVARILIYLPLLVSVVLGLIFMYLSLSQNEDDESGLTYVFDVLQAGALFALSLLVSAICIVIGLIKLRRAKKLNL